MIKIKVDKYRETEREEEFFDLQDVAEEIVERSPAPNMDNEDYPFEKAWEFIEMIIGKLPNIYKHDVEWLDIEIATDGWILLFKFEKDCEEIAGLLNHHLFQSKECLTGYYDPREDERDDCVDEYTGWYYIDFD